MNAILQPFVIFPILLGLTNLVAGTSLPNDVVREGSRLFHANNTLERAYLDRPVEIDGFPCEGWIWFDSTGALTQTELAEDYPFGEVIIPKHSTIFLKSAGIPGASSSRIIDRAWLAHDMTIDGLPVDGGGKIDCAFYPDGRLRTCFLTETLELQGVHVRGGALSRVQFHPDGTLALCTLAEPYESNGETWSAGTEVWLNDDGSVKQSYRPGWLKRMGITLLDVVL